jgi:hypothetical protein
MNSPAETLDWRALEHRDPTAPGERDEIDLDDIDRRNGWTDGGQVRTVRTSPADLTDLADALGRMVDLLAGPRICRQGREASGLRVYALAWALQRGTIGTMTLREAAEACKVTPAAFSLAVRSITEQTGLHWRGQKREGCRTRMSAAARRRWNKRGESVC